MPSPLTTTSYALLGLLVFRRGVESGDAPPSGGGLDESGMTGYEIKQRADNTLRFYWVSPAMSQVYTELGKLQDHGFVEVLDDVDDVRPTRRYRITATGRQSLVEWLHRPEAEFPILKHPIALKLLMGELMDADSIVSMLEAYLQDVARRRVELQAVRDMLGDDPDLRFPALVADWGKAFYRSEETVAREMAERLREVADSQSS